MDFQNHVLTSDGRELLAQAISSNQRIIFVRAMSSTTYMDDAALVDLRPEDLTGPLGIIKTTSATRNVARIITEFTNQPVSAKIKTVAVMARLAAQTDAAAIVMLAQSDPTAGIYIPSTAELNAYIQVTFNLIISATGEVEVTSSANVSLGDHERLLERTVTTHADGDPTVGDNQTIKGSKTFLDSAFFTRDVEADSINANNILPKAANTGSIGSQLQMWDCVMAKNIGLTTPTQGDTPVDTAVITTLYATTIGSNNKRVTNAYMTNLEATSATAGTCTANTILPNTVPIFAPKAYVGTDATPFDEGHFDKINGLHETLWSDGVGGLFQLIVGTSNLQDGDGFERGEIIWNGKTINGRAIGITYFDSTGLVTPPATTKFRALGPVHISSLVPQWTDPVLAVMVEKA